MIDIKENIEQISFTEKDKSQKNGHVGEKDDEDDEESRYSLPDNSSSEEVIEIGRVPSQPIMCTSVIQLDDSDDDCILLELSVCLNELQVGHDTDQHVLPAALPGKKRRILYDACRERNQPFYGNVELTLRHISHEMKNMPVPGEFDKDVLPPGIVPLFDHQLYGLWWMILREVVIPGGGGYWQMRWVKLHF